MRAPVPTVLIGMVGGIRIYDVQVIYQAGTGRRVRLWPLPGRTLSAKILVVCDAKGRPLRFALTVGQAADAP